MPGTCRERVTGLRIAIDLCRKHSEAARPRFHGPRVVEGRYDRTRACAGRFAECTSIVDDVSVQKLPGDLDVGLHVVDSTIVQGTHAGAVPVIHLQYSDWKENTSELQSHSF